MEPTEADIKNQIQTAVEEIDDLKNKRAEVSFVKTAEDLEEGGVGGLDLVLYLSIKLRISMIHGTSTVKILFI